MAAHELPACLSSRLSCLRGKDQTPRVIVRVREPGVGRALGECQPFGMVIKCRGLPAQSAEWCRQLSCGKLGAPGDWSALRVAEKAGRGNGFLSAGN